MGTPDMKCGKCEQKIDIGEGMVCLACYEDIIVKYSFWSANNPLFVLLRIVVVMGFLTLILYANASEFNYTEHRVIAAMFVVVALGESAWAGIKKLISR